MASVTIDVSTNKTSRINLGIQGENIVEQVIFNISSWIEEFGEGVAYVYAKRKGDVDPYPVALEMDLTKGTATWDLTAADTAYKGKGSAQLVYVVDEDGEVAITDDEIKKTRVYATTVQTSLVASSTENPDAYDTWLEVLGGYTARIEAAQDGIEESMTQAAASAATATAKAQLASEYASVATQAKSEAMGSASSAASSEAAAHGWQEGAASSSQAAAASAAAASTSATNAAASETNAAASASDAADSADEAAESAATVTESAEQIATNTADISQLKEDLKPMYIAFDMNPFIANLEPCDTDQYAPKVGQTYIAVASERYIANNKWNTHSTALGILIRLTDVVKAVRFKANASYGVSFAFLKTKAQVVNTTPDYATGYSSPTVVPIGETRMYAKPDDANYLYVPLGQTRIYTPDKVELLIPTVDLPSTKESIGKQIDLTAYNATTYNYIFPTRHIVYKTSAHQDTTWNVADVKTLLLPLDGAKKVYLKASDSNTAIYTFLTTRSTAITRPSYATGYAHLMSISAGAEEEIFVPEDAKYMYVALETSDAVDHTPENLTLFMPRINTSRKKPLFCFVDDDAKADALTWLEQVVDATRIPINIALITGVVGTSTFSTWDNIRRLRNKGFVFVNHTNTTVTLTSLTDEQVTATFEDSQRIMEEHNLPDSDILVLPGGATNASITTKIKNYFTSALSTATRINVPPIDTFYLPRIDLDTYVSGEEAYVSMLDTWKNWVDKAISANALCIFYGHAYHADYGDEKLADYIALVRYIAEKGCDIVSLPEALKQYGNLIEGTVTMGCDEIVD